MKKDEKNGSAGRTIRTRSTSTSANTSAVQETSGLKRSGRGTISKKPITPASGTRKSERLASSPASVSKKSDTVEKKNTVSPLQKSVNGKNVASENSKGSEKSVAGTRLDSEKSRDKVIDNVEESTSPIKKQESTMTGRSHRALFKGRLKKKVIAPANDEELVVVGCSRRIPADNDDVRDGIEDSPPHANSDSKMQAVGKTSLEKGADSPLKSIRDTENMVLDTSPMVETGDDNVIGSPETQKLTDSKASLETDTDLPLKRKRDTAGNLLDACVGNADDCVMSSDKVIPSPSGCENNNKPETCSTCEKRQRVDDEFENLSVCSCIPQPVQKSDHMAQDMEETGPVTSKDCGENWQNIQQEKSFDPKLSSMYPEYWVPVQLSNVQLELYCRTLFSKSLSLSSQSKDLVGALEETLTSVRKTCDHPCAVDVSMKQHLFKNLELHEYLDVEVKASGKLHLLDAMLTQIKMNGFKAVVFYQATQSPGGLLLSNILEDFLRERFGEESYEHGVCSAKRNANAINKFNKEKECFVLLLETRACTQSVKLSRAEAFILFGSSLNPSQDAKFLEKIKIESYSERTKIFRLYSTFTVEEKALILARQNKRQNKALENLTRPLIHALLMWGASYLFDNLDHLHGSETPDSEVPFEQSIMDGVIHEFSSIISSKVGKENEGKLCLLLEAKYAQGTYSTDSTLFGEKHVKLSDEDSPNLFWTKLFKGKNPMWKYCSDTTQRCRKRVRYLPDSKETAETGNDGNIKKRKKASADVTDPPADDEKRKASGKDHMGALESPKVIQSSSSAAFDSLDIAIARIPEDMLAGNEWRKKQWDSQKSLHAVFKREMAKLGKVLHLSEDSTNMVENCLEYVIENYRVYEEPAAILHAFLIALSWIAATLVKQKPNCKESLVRAKSELAFDCSREEADYIYSILYCMKSLFPKRTQRGTMHQEKNNTKSMCSSDNEKCMNEKTDSQYSLARKDVEMSISDIKRKCKKQEQKLAQMYKKKKLDLENQSSKEKRELKEKKVVEAAVIRVSCSGTQSLVDELRLLDRNYEKIFDEIKSETDKVLKDLEQRREAGKKKLAEYEAWWINRIENWAQAELINCLPIKSDNNKQLGGISSPYPSKKGPDVHTCNDANSEAAHDDTNCMVSEGNQVSEAENTLGTMKGGSTQQKPNEDVPSRVPEISQSTSPALNRNEDLVTIEDNRASQVGSDVDNVLDQQNEEAYSLDKEIPDKLALPMPLPASVVETRVSTESDQDDQSICPLPSSPCGNQPDPAANIQGQNTEVAIEPQPAGSETVETGAFAASEQGEQAACLLPSSPAENQLESAANIENQSIRTSAELHIAVPDAVEIGDSAVADQEAMGAQDASSVLSSSVGTQPDLAANMEDQNITTVAQRQEAIGAEVASSLPSSLVGTQPDLAANMEDQNITTVAQREEAIGAEVASSLPSSLVGTQPHLAANTEGQNNTTVSPLYTAGSEAVETGGSPLSDQGAQDASPLPFTSLGNHHDAAVNTEGISDTTISEPRATGLDACEMEIAEPVPLVEQPTLANNLVQIRREVVVEPSAGVTAPIQSLRNNGTGQGSVQHVHHVPFPVFNDPFQHELEKLRRESENINKTFQDKKFVLKDDFERKMAELRAEYERNFHELDTDHKTRTMENENNRNLILMNKLLANAFSSKCTDKNASRSSVAPRGRIQQLAQRAVELNALRNLMPPAPTLAPSPTLAPPPAPLQPQASSYLPPIPSWPSVLPRSSTLCPMPQPRQPLISNTGPSPSVTPAANPVVNGRLRSPAPHLNAYRSSSSIPTATTASTSPSLPQALTYANALLQQQLRQQQHQQQQQQQHQQQQQNLGSGLQGSSDVVCLSDDE